jgi:hypothetical protein
MPDTNNIFTCDLFRVVFRLWECGVLRSNTRNALPNSIVYYPLTVLLSLLVLKMHLLGQYRNKQISANLGPPVRETPPMGYNTLLSRLFHLG